MDSTLIGEANSANDAPITSAAAAPAAKGDGTASSAITKADTPPSSPFFDDDLNVEAILADPRANRVVTLPSGRKVGCSDLGSEATDALPVVFMGGVATHRYFGIFFHASALRRNLRFITLERPGTGLSEPLSRAEERSRVPCCAAVMAEAIKELGVSRFALLGQCFGAIVGGKVVAAAEAGAVASVQLVSPWLSPKEPGTKRLFSVARGLPGWAIGSFMALSGNLQHHVLTTPGGVKMVADGVGADERHVWDDPRTLRVNRAVVAASKRGEYSNGWIKDSKAALEMKSTGDFEFTFAQLKQAVDIYVGEDDGMLPLPAVEAFAKKLPNVRRLYLKPEGTHSLLFDSEVVAMALDQICLDRDGGAQFPPSG